MLNQLDAAEIMTGVSASAFPVEAEVADFLARHADRKTEDGRRRVVRHGHLPERAIMTGIRPVAVRQPRVRGRCGRAHPVQPEHPAALCAADEEPRSAASDPKGVSTGDFEEALAALVGKDAPGLSTSTIARLKEA
jgi:hypothetical protein